MKKGKLRSLLAIFTAVITLLGTYSGVFNFENVDVSYAAGTSDAEFEAYMTAQGFPESYKPYLRKLHAEHPNWIFQAMQTGLSWNMTIKNEMVYSRNLIPNSTRYVSSWKDYTMANTFNWTTNEYVIISAPNWVQASEQAVCYAIDPRNFLNDEYIFQFEQLTYNESAQTLEGVEAILKGTFMDNVIVPGTGDATPSDYLTSDKYAVTDETISGLNAETMVKAFVSGLKIKDTESYSQIVVIGKDGKMKGGNDLVATGDTVRLVGKTIVKETTAAEITAAETTVAAETTETLATAEEQEVAETTTASETTTAETTTQETTAETTKIDDVDVGNIILMGDINCDGKINSIDRGFLKLYLYEKTTFNDNQEKAADLNHDGKINSVDRGYLKLYLYGKTSIDNVYSCVGMTYAEVFYKIGKELNVSPYMIAARVYQEQGSGTSPLISGTVSGYEGYYNYFNIEAYGATQTDIVVNGLNEAKENGWTSPYKAIVGGATKLCSNYIWKGQDTLYLQKFDVESEYCSTYWHQYMQNLLAARNEGTKAYKSYSSLGALELPYVFKIPVYIGMPDSACAIPTIDGNPNFKLKSLSVAGYTINFNMDTYSYTIRVPRSVSSLTVSATPAASTTKVAGTGKIKIDMTTTSISVNTLAENGLPFKYTIYLNRY